MLISAATVTAPSATGLHLAGYARRRVAVSEAHPLEANLLLFEDKSRRPILLVVFDVLFVGAALLETLRGRLPDVEVLAFATHTHGAPATDPGKPRLGAYEAAWTEEFARRVVHLTRILLRNGGKEASLYRAAGPIPGAVYRRRHWPWPVLSRQGLRKPRTVMAPNPAIEIPHTAHSALLRTADGAPLALLCSWACHPTSNPNDVATSDYVGPLRAAFRARFGDIPVLFLQGFAGDIRPTGAAPKSWESLRTILLGPRFTPFSDAERTAWEARIAQAVHGLSFNAAGEPMESAATVVRTHLQLAEFLDGAPERAVEVGTLSAGPLRLSFIEAEPCCGHIDAFAAALPGYWPIGYAGDVFGYLPTDAQVRQGGYEVHGYMPLFGMSGVYRGSVDAALGGALQRLAGAFSS